MLYSSKTRPRSRYKISRLDGEIIAQMQSADSVNLLFRSSGNIPGGKKNKR
jgi:hypothetical protein